MEKGRRDCAVALPCATREGQNLASTRCPVFSPQLEPVPPRDQFVIAYGGLRGAIAFALATVLIPDDMLCVDGTSFTPFLHRDLIVRVRHTVWGVLNCYW